MERAYCYCCCFCLGNCNLDGKFHVLQNSFRSDGKIGLAFGSMDVWTAQEWMLTIVGGWHQPIQNIESVISINNSLNCVVLFDCCMGMLVANVVDSHKFGVVAEHCFLGLGQHGPMLIDFVLDVKQCLLMLDYL